ncbi:hypothetical protein GGF50DRAFT_127119 [Schizophyllum commune]
MRLFVVAAFGASLLLVVALMILGCYELRKRARRTRHRSNSDDVERDKDDLADFSKVAVHLPESPRSTFSISSDPFRRSLRSAFSWDRAVTPQPLRLEPDARKPASPSKVLHKKPPSLSTSVRTGPIAVPLPSPSYRSPLSQRPQQGSS